LKRIIIATLILFQLVTLNAEEMTVLFDSSRITFDPAHAITTAEAQFFTGIYEGLVTYHPQSLEPVPGIAQSWEISPDKLTYTFNLNPAARYSDGREITAEDIRQSWVRLIHPDTGGEYASLLDIVTGVRDFRLRISEDPESLGITSEDDHTLKVTLIKPAAHFLNILCHHSFVPFHPDQTLSSFSGPFYPEKTDDGYRLIKNPYYWDAPNVALDKIRILYVDDPGKKTDLFNKDQAQWVADSFDFSAVSWRPAITYNSLFATSYFYFKALEAPYDNPKVRRGLIQLLPWGEIRSNQLFPTETLIPYFPSYPEVEGITHQDKEAALEELKQVGFTSDTKLPPITIRISQSRELYRIAQIMKESWEEVFDLEVIIDSYPYGEYFEALARDDYTLGNISWIGDFADPLTFLQMWTSDSNLNDAAFSDKDYDLLVEKAAGEPRPDRFTTQAEAEKRLLQSGIILPLGNSAAYNLIDTFYIQGWYENPLDIHPFKYLDYGEGLILPGVASRGITDSMYPVVQGFSENHR